MKRPRCTAEVASLRRRAVPVLQQAGFEISEISALFAIDANNYAQRPGVCKPDLARDATMASMFRDGKTLEYIGAQFDISRERVRQILKRAGVIRLEGGAAKLSKDRRSRDALRRDAACLSKYGCTRVQWQELQALQAQSPTSERGPLGAFRRQKSTAKVRSIGWALTLWQWWTIWQESGKWKDRGRGDGHYCMSRIGDAGEYAVGNVRIITNNENAAESYTSAPANQRNRRLIDRDELGLTVKERAYFDLANAGFTTSEIARQIGVKAGTASCMLVNLRKRGVPIKRPNRRTVYRPAPSQEAAA